MVLETVMNLCTTEPGILEKVSFAAKIDEMGQK